MAPRTIPPSFLRSSLSRRKLLYGFTAVTASSLLSGCGAALIRPESSSTGSEPAPSALAPQPLPTGSLTSASLLVTATPAGAMDSGFLGLAYEKQSLLTPLFSPTNPDLVGLFRRLGTGVLRLGGASVDYSTWTPDGQGQTPGQVAPPDVDALASFLHATGWACIYGLNLGGSSTGTTSPALAAAEVDYVAQKLGSALVAIELGNACESYGNTFYPGNWSVEMFEALWQQYRTAIIAITPAAAFCGPAAATDLDSWTLPFGEYITSSQLSLLTQQYARGPASTAAIDDLLSSDAALAAEMLTLHYGAQSINVPFRIAALSSYDNGGAPGVSDTFASALWAIDTTFQAALAGASGLNFVSGGQQSSALIADSENRILGPQPAFYGLLLTSMAGTGTLLTTQLSAGSLNVTAYVLRSSNGSMSIVVVNKDVAQSLDLRIALPEQMSVATLQQLSQLSAGATGPSPSAHSGITFQGATVASDGSFQPGAAYFLTLSGTQLSCYIPALSAVLIQLSE